jgi:hypothetical protein
LTPFYQSDSSILPLSRDILVGPATKLLIVRSLITTVVTGELPEFRRPHRARLSWPRLQSSGRKSDSAGIVQRTDAETDGTGSGQRSQTDIQPAAVSVLQVVFR